MKLEVLKEFTDYSENVIRKPGDVFECSDARADEIREGLKRFDDKAEWVREVEPIKGQKAKTELDEVEPPTESESKDEVKDDTSTSRSRKSGSTKK